jgi:hypothetical protein
VVETDARDHVIAAFMTRRRTHGGNLHTSAKVGLVIV